MPQPGWQDLPPPVRQRISDELGARVLGWTTLPMNGVGGAAAMSLQTATGTQVCTVVNTADPRAQELARRAIDVVAVLPAGAPVPSLLWWFDEDLGQFGRWIVASWGMRDIRPIGDEWTEEEVGAALGVLREIREFEAPADGPFLDSAELFGAGPWRRLAEERPEGLRNFTPWLEPRLEALAEIAVHSAEAVSGDTLVHGSPTRHTLYPPLSPDGRPVAAAWARAARGAPFVDTVLLLAHIRAEGGPAPEVVLARHPLSSDTDPDAVTCLVTALTGQLVEQALHPERAEPGERPSVLRAHASVCVEWLRRRLGF
ncbi:hypothetical protein [Myceligenerans pegani]|uniref:Uncharacterized protein n=1 Tax=Myceligenerans pegani TaxID=2776917 RepID=A0ABR9N0Y6_9MICO|nr:hypothetical protein [Myceligenerans sp. TRM 65318]MBE1877322.1 hypothetical protein [Myceligenerans sp. TRM 65318]MBE3019593.1 hypothetical protein [Myceligenerans sp. TRM 65318]